MRNTMNETLKTFVEKVQRVGMELYEEYNSLENGVEFTCPLTDVIDSLYALSCMDTGETIKEN